MESPRIYNEAEARLLLPPAMRLFNRREWHVTNQSCRSVTICSSFPPERVTETQVPFCHRDPNTPGQLQDHRVLPFYCQSPLMPLQGRGLGGPVRDHGFNNIRYTQYSCLNQYLSLSIKKFFTKSGLFSLRVKILCGRYQHNFLNQDAPYIVAVRKVE